MSLPLRLPPRSIVFLASLLLTSAIIPSGLAFAQAGAARAVYINRNRLPTDTLQMLESLEIGSRVVGFDGDVLSGHPRRASADLKVGGYVLPVWTHVLTV